MSYRCDFCRAKAPPGQSELRHQVLRPDGSILREHRVCRRCQQQLAAGALVNLVGAQPTKVVCPNLFPVRVPAAIGEEV